MSTINLPSVSLCTPTFNRRPFIQNMLNCVFYQEYPKKLIEWIIVDDGTDPIEDIILDYQTTMSDNSIEICKINYKKINEKMPLGKKRNLINSLANNEILIYIDDDDYYPPTRIQHAVESLIDSNCLVAGSTILYNCFLDINQTNQTNNNEFNPLIVKFGEYGLNHSTEASLAFKKVLLEQTKYDDNSSLAEAKVFLKNYTIPMIQLDPFKTVLAMSHNQSSIDRNKLLDDRLNGGKTLKTNLELRSFIVNKKQYDEFYNFYKGISNVVRNYEEGDLKYKTQIHDALERINKQHDEMIKYFKQTNISDLDLKKEFEESVKTYESLMFRKIKKNLCYKPKTKLQTKEDYDEEIELLTRLIHSLLQR
jgi:glycosyltransferase involved in cell wall biosynthesis